MSKHLPLIITLAAAAVAPTAASADSPATPAERGDPTPITEARLDGSRLTVSLRCRRAATVTIAGREHRVACRGGRGRAQARVRRGAPVKLAVRVDGRTMTATLPFGSKPGTARAAAWQTWRDGSALCEHVDFLGNRNPVRIGITNGSSFGLRFGERFAWRTWIYWLDARGGSGFIPGSRSFTGYAGMNGGYAGHDLWNVNPGYRIRPVIEVTTASGYGDWNFVRVNGAFPSPAFDASWCRY
jgi:hypothetical protein